MLKINRMPNVLLGVIFCIVFSNCNNINKILIENTIEYNYEFGSYSECSRQLKLRLIQNENDVESHRLYQEVEIELNNYSRLYEYYYNKYLNNKENCLYNYLYGRLLYYKMNKHYDSIKLFNKCIELDKHFPWSYNALAGIYLNENNILKAISLLEECIKNRPEFIDSYILMSKCILRINGPEKAIEYLISVLNKFRNQIDFEFELVDLYILIYNKKEALNILNKLLRDIKYDYRYHRALFQLSTIIDNTRKKKNILIKYWENYPNSNNIVTVFNQLYALYKDENINKANIFALSATKRDTKIVRLSSIAYSKIIETNRNDDKKLVEIANEILKSNMNNPNVLNKLGEMLIKNGKEKIAIMLFEKSIKYCNWENLKNNVVFGQIINSDDQNAKIELFKNISLINLGKAYYKMAEFQKAISYLQKVNHREVFLNEEANYILANCYFENNNIDKAIDILEFTYREYGSQKAFTMINKMKNANENKLKIKNGNNQNDTRKILITIKNKELLKVISNKYSIICLYETNCKACIDMLNIMNNIKNRYENNKIVFINLLYENNANIVNKNILINRELYFEIVNEIKISSVPCILFINDKKQIRYIKYGIKENEDNAADIEFKIKILLEDWR